MPQNGINHPGVTALAQAFAINPLLRVINLNDNTFTEKGAVAMAKVREVQQGRSGPREPGLVALFSVHPPADGCSPPGPPTSCVPVASATCACPGRGNCHQGAWALGPALCVCAAPS